MTPASAASTQATFCATLVDEWARAGVRLAVVSPGSRSTPLALALVADARIEVQVHHDERCTAFIALGHGLATGVPALALCTSGTAATHFHAAVVEAHHAGVPLIVCTADRPPELRGIGAPQTIDQAHLYGSAVRWYFDPGPADESGRDGWRDLAARAVDEAVAGRGPVHLNLPFREPLIGEPGPLPAAVGRTAPVAEDVAPGPAVVAGRRPLVVSTTQALPGSDRVPVLGGGRTAAAPNLVAHADALLRVPALAADLVPDAVVRVGRPPASRVVDEWLATTGAPVLHVGPHVEVPHGAVVVASCELPEPEPGWLERWLALDAAAESAIAAVLAAHPEPTEPATARDVLGALPAGSHLVVSSSMPVRDLEWYARPRLDVTVHANRGANGIDGVLSTAVGVALASRAPTACLLGDVAFLHDSNALLGIAERGIDLAVVVVDNDGGGIFSFLPQASALPAAPFERLFGTPHGVKPEHLAAAHGLASITVESADGLAPTIAATAAAGGVHVVVVRTDRSANVELHAELHAAVAAATVS
jgi:2-succinyl-5-enolpyruvyl-6-hydroxy-3-cyclohexene-1-carboxylate synthase